MQKYEFVFENVNNDIFTKSITVMLIQPDSVNDDTGAMLFTHGWGGNRYQHQDKMEYTVDKFNLICISVEYRQSGYDFDSVKGVGSCMPYDASFYQVFDILNGLHEVLKLFPFINRKRLFHYGTSQGGHIALLSSIFAPNTFAGVYASSPLVRLTSEQILRSGRDFKDYELNIRNVLAHADKINCPLMLEHGTADMSVPCEHTRMLETAMKSMDKYLEVNYFEGGGHSLMPTISKLKAYKKHAHVFLEKFANEKNDDFLAENLIDIDCGSRKLIIDWSQKSNSVDLFTWRNK